MEPEIYQEAIQTTINPEIPQIQTVIQDGFAPISTIINAPFVEVTSVNGMTGDVVVEVQMQDFEANHFYKKNTAVLYNGALYTAKADFTSGNTFNLSDWNNPDFVQEQADWTESDNTKDSYIKNKPANLVQDADYNHTDNNYTDLEKTKLSEIAAGAEVNVQSDWNETDSADDAFIKNKPTLFTDANILAGSNITKTTSNGNVTLSRNKDAYTVNMRQAIGSTSGTFSNYNELVNAVTNGIPIAQLWTNGATIAENVSYDENDNRVTFNIKTENDIYEYTLLSSGNWSGVKRTQYIRDELLDETITRMVYLGDIDPSDIPVKTDSAAQSELYRLPINDYFKHPDTHNFYFDKIRIIFHVHGVSGTGYVRFGSTSAGTGHFDAALRQAILLKQNDTMEARTGEMPNLFWRTGYGTDTTDTYVHTEMDFDPIAWTNDLSRITKLAVTYTNVAATANLSNQLISFGSRLTLADDGTTGVWVSDGLQGLQTNDKGYIKVYGIKYATNNNFIS